MRRWFKEVSMKLVGKQASAVQEKLQGHSSRGLSLPPCQNELFPLNEMLLSDLLIIRRHFLSSIFTMGTAVATILFSRAGGIEILHQPRSPPFLSSVACFREGAG